MSSALGPQFLYHGTAKDVQGAQILPASVHGGHSYWGDTGSTRGEPSQDHAWAHPDEDKTWEFAHDRANFELVSEGRRLGEDPVIPRARVFALHPNENQSPGGDPSIPGEVKSTHFDIAHPIDTMPGRQGTFPGVNWNEYTKGSKSRYLPGDEDANHPTDLSIQFGHRAGVHGNYGQPERTIEHLQHAAQQEDVERSVDRRVAVHKGYLNRHLSEDTPLPLPPKGARR